MHWTEVLIVICSNFGLFLWIRQETRSDTRLFENEMRKWKDEINLKMNEFQIHLFSIENKT